MSGTLVSILIPCYNAAPWLAETLESALAQTWAHKEIIVVDDGSRDGSAPLARTYEPRGVQVLTQTNKGAAAARNTAYAASHGNFIQFLDADDLLAPDKIARQMALAATQPQACLISGEWARFTSKASEARFAPMPTWRDLGAVEFQQIVRETNGMMHPAAWLCARSLLDKSGPWDETLTVDDDGEYFQRVMLHAGRINFCPGARSFYRSQLGASLSGRKDRRSLEKYHRAAQLRQEALLAADRSPRTVAAVAYAWKQAAFELYPVCPELARDAEVRSLALGGSVRPFCAGGRFQLAARLLGWRLAKRWFHHT